MKDSLSSPVRVEVIRDGSGRVIGIRYETPDGVVFATAEAA